MPVEDHRQHLLAASSSPRRLERRRGARPSRAARRTSTLARATTSSSLVDDPPGEGDEAVLVVEPRAPTRRSPSTWIVSPIRTGRLKATRVEAAQRDHALGVERRPGRRSRRAAACRGRSARRSSLAAAHSASVCCGCKSPVSAAKETRSASVIVRPRRDEAVADLERVEVAGARRWRSPPSLEVALDSEAGAQRARRISRAARRWPSGDGWRPSAEKFARLGEAGMAGDLEAGHAVAGGDRAGRRVERGDPRPRPGAPGSAAAASRKCQLSGEVAVTIAASGQRVAQALEDQSRSARRSRRGRAARSAGRRWRRRSTVTRSGSSAIASRQLLEHFGAGRAVDGEVA